MILQSKNPLNEVDPLTKMYEKKGKTILAFKNRMADIDTKKSARKRIDAVIVHIHGGGFVAMSSSSHGIYTRKWSKDAKIPVFSIDYRLSPQN